MVAKKGTPNKKSQLLEDIFDSNNFNVPEQLISLLLKLPADKQATILLSLMDYIYPKRKSVELSQREADEHDTITGGFNFFRVPSCLLASWHFVFQ